jgi:putative SOS response-associated peptidase YedK
MCGRYSLAAPADDLVEAFDVPPLSFEYVPSYNISPGRVVPVVAQDRMGRRMGLMKWGFVPGWSGDPGRGFINARSESVAKKRSFRHAFAQRRCLVPADGFYEWKRPADTAAAGSRSPPGSPREPYWIHPVGGGLLAFAGIWEMWRGVGGDRRHGFAILTAAANGEVRSIHERMPVVVSATDHAAWLERSTSVARLEELLRPASDGTFECRRVDTRVNRTAEDDEGLVAPVDP